MKTEFGDTTTKSTARFPVSDLGSGIEWEDCGGFSDVMAPEAIDVLGFKSLLMAFDSARLRIPAASPSASTGRVS
jgi:hypothetical protein